MGPGSRDGVEIGPIDPFGRHESPRSVAATTFDEDEYLPDLASESRDEDDDHLIWHPRADMRTNTFPIWHPRAEMKTTTCDR